MKAAIIYNPSAGSSRGSVIAAAVQQGLAARGLDTELHATRGPGDATAIAERLALAVDIIVAVGGDGTVNEIVNGMCYARESSGVESPSPVVGPGGDAASASPRTWPPASPRTWPPASPRTWPPAASPSAPTPARRTGPLALLGIVPAGTVNVLALELELPRQIDKACDVIARGKTIALDVGQANNRYFVLMMGAGIDALTVRHVDPQAKKRFKQLAFIGTGATKLAAGPPSAFLVRTGGREYRTTFFVAGNSRYYAGRLTLTRDADPTDGLLDLLLFTGTSRLSLAVFWLEVPAGLHMHNRNVTCLRAQEAELLPEDGPQVIWFQTDGEAAGILPATVKIHPRALEVLAP